MSLREAINIKKGKHLCQIIMGGIFIYASIGKIINPELFAQIISDYRLLPSFLIKPVSLTLPLIELIIGIFLVLNIYPKIAAVIACFLLLIFIFAVSSLTIRGINIDCGCFSVTNRISESTKISLWFTLFRDIIFFTLGIIIFLAPVKRSSIILDH